VADDELWRVTKADGFTGWSIAGSGIRTPL
jgi:hypothetical protein